MRSLQWDPLRFGFSIGKRVANTGMSIYVVDLSDINAKDIAAVTGYKRQMTNQTHCPCLLQMQSNDEPNKGRV